MFNLDRESYEKQWNDIKAFVEYACLRDGKFYSKAESAILYEKHDGGFTTIDEYLENAKEKHENKVYYASDKVSQASYISMFENSGIDVLLLPHVIDTQFAQLIETKKDGVQFLRVDAELDSSMKGDSSEELPRVLEIFKAIVPEECEIKFEALKDESLPAILTVSENSRRMADMMRMYASMGQNAPMFPTESTLILNSSSPIIKGLGEKESEKASLIAKHIYSLCTLTSGKMNSDDIKAFLADSYNILSML